MLLPRQRQLTKSDTCRCNHSRYACSMKLRCTSCSKVDDGNWLSADAPFWWTLMLKLKAFTLSSAGALWLAQRCPGRWSSSGPNGEVGRGPTTRLAVDRTSKLQSLPPPRDRRCGAVRCGAVGGGRAIQTLVASGSRPAPETPLNQRAVERTLCSDQSAHAGGWITRGEVLICTTDE